MKFKTKDLNKIIACLRKMGLSVMPMSHNTGNDTFYIDGLRHTRAEILKIWG